MMKGLGYGAAMDRICGLTLPLRSDYGMYQEQLDELKAKQLTWRRKHDKLMTRKSAARNASGERRCPTLIGLPAAVSRPHTADSGGPIAVAASTLGEQRRKPRRTSATRKDSLLPSIGVPGWIPEADAGTEVVPHHEPPQEEDAAHHGWRPPSTGERHPGGHGRAFDICLHFAGRSSLPLKVVKESWDDFVAMDREGNGVIMPNEFEEAIRKKCCIPEGMPVPQHLLQQDRKQMDTVEARGAVNFPAYLQWSLKNAFSEELVVEDANERRLRAFARKHGFSLDQVEALKRTFDKFDSDGSGAIELDEFRHVLAEVLDKRTGDEVPAATMRRYYAEISNGRPVEFEDFALWYLERCGEGAS